MIAKLFRFVMIDKLFLVVFAMGGTVFGGVWAYTSIMGTPDWEAGGLMILCSVFFHQSWTDMRLGKIEAWIKDIASELDAIPTPAWRGEVDMIDVVNEAGRETEEGTETT